MLVHDFVYVDVPASSVSDRIVDGAGAWLGGVAFGATREGDELRVRLAPYGVDAMLAKDVVLDVGESRSHARTTVIPLSWRATGMASAFPVFRGDLEVAALGDERSQISIWGQYDPPLGPLGRCLDQFLLHRVAEASVRTFLRGIADAVSEVHAGS